MKDEQRRDKGKYIEETETAIEETVIGNNYEILSFSREYFNPEPYKITRADGSYENIITKSIKGKTFKIITTTVIKDFLVVDHFTTKEEIKWLMKNIVNGTLIIWEI